METTTSQEHVVRSLIIDDEADTCTLISHLLSKRKILNKSVYNLNDSKKLLKEHHFDLIFLDNHLPDGTGIDFIPYLKNISPQPEIIMITASQDLPAGNTLYKKGIDWFLPKPLHSKTINEVIDKILKKDFISAESNPSNFIISFQFANKKEKAEVIKTVFGQRTEYKIMPISMGIVHQFGKEVIVFKEDENFSVNTSGNEAYNDFLNIVTNAVRDQE